MLSNFVIWRITLATAFWTFCKRSSWYLGRPKRSEFQWSRREDTKAWTSVFVDCMERNFLLWVMLKSPRKTSLWILPMLTFIRIRTANQDPSFRIFSRGAEYFFHRDRGGKGVVLELPFPIPWKWMAGCWENGSSYKPVQHWLFLVEGWS